MVGECGGEGGVGKWWVSGGEGGVGKWWVSGGKWSA